MAQTPNETKTEKRSTRVDPTIPQIIESSINIVSEGTRLEGKIVFEAISRVHGELYGEISGRPGSTLILAETSMTEGNIDGDVVWIDGFVRGKVRASTRVVVSQTGRVIGEIRAPSVRIETGAHFDGSCAAGEDVVFRADRPASSLKPTPA
jgi:cytoskeletal protein CcmA (bactofilin family)